MEKGALLFGKNYNNRASADFLKLLLVYIKNWGSFFQTYQGTQKPTEMHKIYQVLVKERIYFPSEEAVLSSICNDYSADPNSN